MKKAFLAAVFSLVVCVSCVCAGQVKLTLDGKELVTSPAPVIRGGRVFIPVTAFLDIGMAVDVQSERKAWVGWPESDGIIHFEAGCGEYNEGALAGEIKMKKLPGVPFVRKGVLMVPLRAFLSDKTSNPNLTATWDKESNTVHIFREKKWLQWRLEIDEEVSGRKDKNWYKSIR